MSDCFDYTVSCNGIIKFATHNIKRQFRCRYNLAIASQNTALKYPKYPDSLPSFMTQFDNKFIGLAPFLRMSINGDDLRSTCQDLLTKAADNPENSNLWMNLSTAMLCIEQRDIGLSIQSQALEMSRIYHLAAATQPAKLRLLMLMTPGDLAANTPLDCLLENTDIDLIYYYLSSGDPLAEPIPDHDALMVAFSELEENNSLIDTLSHRLKDWPRPVINAPLCIPSTRRDNASRLLQDIPGLFIPATFRVSRRDLKSVANAKLPLSELIANHDFPIILRPLDSHAGRDLVKIENTAEIAEYLSRVEDATFFLSKFIDYSGEDGQFRKFRIAIIDGTPFACHMAISSHWMIHYVNAGMYEDAAKRNEERLFMEKFDSFVQRHSTALNEVHQRTGLDYLCLDCAETASGELLIFEIDHAMIVHAMDNEALFPHKRHHMEKVSSAFRDYLLRRAVSETTSS